MDIALLDVNTGEITPLVTSPAEDYAPAFSPDGRLLARSGNRRDFYLYGP